LARHYWWGGRYVIARLVVQMRCDAAASAIRCVRVRQWRDGSELADAPLLYKASYRRVSK